MAKLSEIVAGTLSQIKNETLDPNSLYKIDDYPLVGITNAQMAAALTQDFKIFFQTDDVFICIDSGTYLKGRAYKYTGSTWVLISEYDEYPTENSNKPVTSGGIFEALSSKQDALSFDQTPTDNSTNPITSGGVKNYVDSAIGNINTVLESLL